MNTQVTVHGVLFLCLCLALAAAGQPATGLHEPWDELLGRHVSPDASGLATRVDYTGFAVDRAELRRYLDALAAVRKADFDTWKRADQLAFLINAYNAWTVELVLEGFPDIDSIKELGTVWRSPWQRKIADLLGERRSLDNIEHGLIRGSGRYEEPRVHFAVNCASRGCPALQPWAWRGEQLESQLASATRAFLADRTRNRMEDGSLHVSRIFDWYREDFESGWRGVASLGEFLARYGRTLGLAPATARSLAAGELRIRFLPYDWRLNALSRDGSAVSDTRD